MTSGFQAVRDDLRRAAGTFGTESVTLRTVMSPDGPEGTGVGSPQAADPADGDAGHLWDSVL